MAYVLQLTICNTNGKWRFILISFIIYIRVPLQCNSFALHKLIITCLPFSTALIAKIWWHGTAYWLLQIFQWVILCDVINAVVHTSPSRVNYGVYCKYFITMTPKWARWRLKSLNHLFTRRSKKISKVRVSGLCVGNSPVTGEFPAQRASNAENVSIWWRHHVGELNHVTMGSYRVDEK